MDSPFKFSKKTIDIMNDSSSEKKRPKRLLWFLSALLLLFMIATGVFAALFFTNRSNESKNDDKNICLTPYCVRAANYLIESINKSVEPCEDFYQFACGNWLERTRIPDDTNVINSFRILDKQLDDNIIDLLSSSKNNDENLQSAINARLLYRTCLNETNIELEGIQPILDLVNNELGGWPLIENSRWNESSFNLSNLLIKLRELNNNFLFSVGTETDERNSSVADIKIGQGTLGLPQRQYYENETAITAAYRDFMKNLAIQLTNETLTSIDDDVREVFQFEKNISEFYWTSDEQRARSNETTRIEFSQLSTVLEMSFDLNNFLRATYSLAGISVDQNDIIVVSELDFLKNLSSIIQQSSPKTLQNYFIWRFLQIQSSNLPRRIRTVKDQFNRIFQQTSAERPRTVQCAILVNNDMGFIVSKLYIKEYFDENARNQSIQMIDTIRRSFINLINQSSWMEETSKEKAIHKAQVMAQQIGYPDYLASSDTSKIEQQYAEYRFENSFFKNQLKLLNIKTKEALKSLHEPVDRTAWGSLPPTVINAFYEPSQNQITFPAGILQTPFFNKDAPKYLNYGGIGAVIGHEITHGFDDEGRQFDENGNRIPWWTQPTIEQFNIKKQCIVDQYSNYSIPTVPLHSNGAQTQGEDIADNGGIKASYFAYEKWASENPNQDKRLPGLDEYSPEQLFFMNFAHIWCVQMTDNYAYNRILTDPHSLGPFRVRGPTSNFDRFDQAFGCRKGQGNSRNDKCSVW